MGDASFKFFLEMSRLFLTTCKPVSVEGAKEGVRVFNLDENQMWQLPQSLLVQMKKIGSAILPSVVGHMTVKGKVAGSNPIINGIQPAPYLQLWALSTWGGKVGKE